MRDRPARRIRHRGTIESRHDADALLEAPGDLVIVHRGVARSAVVCCPDGCGSILTVNLDARVGRAWRAYHREDGLSLYPSIWRDGGCGAHFIVWRDSIIWCSPRGPRGSPPTTAALLTAQVWRALDSGPRTVLEIADVVDAVPWDARQVLDELVEEGAATRTRENPTRYTRTPESHLGGRPKSDDSGTPRRFGGHPANDGVR